MKWYMALNEGGTRGDIGLHTKIAVLSARRHTTLKPILLYTGVRNEFTRWLEYHGVDIVDHTLPYIDLVDRLVNEGRYFYATVGHWLRTSVCLVESTDDFVLYSDIDIIFRRDPQITAIKPAFFAAAPEFDLHTDNYFNAGVMIQNVEELRRTYKDFEHYLRENIQDKTYRFNDQQAYNIYYRGQWDKLNPIFNWKPYWGANVDAEIVHFHGPKIGAVESIMNHSWNWKTDHGKQIGSMLVAFLPSYRRFFTELLDESHGVSDDESKRLERILIGLNRFQPDRSNAVDTSFMGFRMF